MGKLKSVEKRRGAESGDTRTKSTGTRNIKWDLEGEKQRSDRA